MDYFDIKEIADRVGTAVMSDLKSGNLKKVGRDEIEVAADAAIDGLSPDDRETLIGLICRRVVSLCV